MLGLLVLLPRCYFLAMVSLIPTDGFVISLLDLVSFYWCYICDFTVLQEVKSSQNTPNVLLETEEAE